jgi:tRNA (cmo5U34)-methyltransferase
MRDETLPKGKWDFDDKVTAVFDDMLERSIPQYHIMREGVASLVQAFVKEGDNIIEIGCSNGIGLEQVIKSTENNCSYIGLEISEPMLKEAQKRLKGYKNVDIYNADVRFHNFDTHAQVILSVLTLMFIPIEYRQQVVDKCYQALPEGGAFIVVEKILGETGNLNNLYVNEYLRMKEKNGYSQEQIDRKRHSLEGVLVPLTATWNKQLLTSAGFRYIDCFWRWMNFAGWIAIK